MSSACVGMIALVHEQLCVYGGSTTISVILPLAVIARDHAALSLEIAYLVFTNNYVVFTIALFRYVALMPWK